MTEMTSLITCVCVVRLQRSADRKKFSPSEEERWKLVPKICRVSKRISARWRTLSYPCFISMCSNICQLFSVTLFMFPLKFWSSFTAGFVHFNKLLIIIVVFYFLKRTKRSKTIDFFNELFWIYHIIIIIIYFFVSWILLFCVIG